jgi:hypothetical protein
MMADGDVDALESKIFQTMLTGYGHDNASFKPFYQSIKVKNIKTFSASVLKPKLIYSNVASGHDSDEKGVRFNRDNSFQEDAADAGDKLGTAASKGPTISHVLPGQEGAHAGNRTMQDNINKVAQGFGDEDRVHQVQENALADQNIQGVPSAGVEANIQSIDDHAPPPAAAGPVLQSAGANGSGPILLNTDAAPTNKALIDEAQNSAKVIGQPSHTLKNNVAQLPHPGLADRNLPLASKPEGSHSVKLASVGGVDNAIKLASTGALDNAIKLAAPANEDHLENLPSTQGGVNVQAAPDAALTTNRQALPSQPAGTNRQATPTATAGLNRQAIDADLMRSNRAHAPIQTVGTHRAKLPDAAATRPSPTIAKHPGAAPGQSLTHTQTAAQKANRLQLLSQNVSQLRLRLDQLAGLNHDVLAAAQQASGGPCINCGNPKCLFTHHIKTG